MKLNDIAKELNISPSSISIVRRGVPGVSLKTRMKIQALLDKYGYAYKEYPSINRAPDESPKRFIRLIKYRKSSLLTDKNEGFVDAIIDSIDAQARMHDYTILINAVSHDEYHHFLETLATETYSGLMVVATEMERADICVLSKLSAPMVILDSDHADLPFTTVTMNNRDLAYKAASYLLSIGHPEVGYLSSSIRTGNFISRANGYREALADHGLCWNGDIVYPLRPSTDGAYEDMRVHLSRFTRLPSAFFADNDIVAIGAMRALIEHGVAIPEDVSIIGVDNTPLSNICTPALSTMQISRTSLGKLAFSLLLEQITAPFPEPIHIRLGSCLINRKSVARHI